MHLWSCSGNDSLKEFGVDLATIKTLMSLDAAMVVADETNMEMPDGRPPSLGLPELHQLSPHDGPGIWWTDANGDPELKNPAFKEAAADVRFHDYHMDIDEAIRLRWSKRGRC